MSANTYDVIVLGVGGMGSAACWHLARRGVRVLGLERFDIPHAMGSSHGFNRIIRLAYFEDPSYVPLLRRAYENWRELEGRFGEQLLFITGSIDAGPEGSAMVEGLIGVKAKHQAPELAERIARKFGACSWVPRLVHNARENKLAVKLVAPGARL